MLAVATDYYSVRQNWCQNGLILRPQSLDLLFPRSFLIPFQMILRDNNKNKKKYWLKIA